MIARMIKNNENATPKIAQKISVQVLFSSTLTSDYIK